jgi:hypothetical protein
MSALTNAVTIVVSESSVVRLFCHGKMVGEDNSGIVDVGSYGATEEPGEKEQFRDLAVFTPTTGRVLAPIE